MNDRREIKFRGKRIDNNEWVYGHYFVSPLTDENSGTTPDKGWFFLSGEKRHCIEQNHASFVIDPKTISQFIDLHDKNGEEIYEGDICKVDDGDNIYEVIFYMGGFRLAVLPRKIRVYDIGSGLFKNIEIIGTTYKFMGTAKQDAR